MKQLWVVFKFEFSNYCKSKPFIIFGAIVCAFLLIATSIPTGINLFKGSDKSRPATEETDGKQPNAYLIDPHGILNVDTMGQALQKYNWAEAQNLSDMQIEQDIEDGKIELAVVVLTELDYKVFSKNYQQGERAKAAVGEELAYLYQVSVMASMGMTAEAAHEALNIQPNGTLISQGEDYMQNYFYAYAIVFLFYMAILIYGQLIASAVVAEKTSKAMEILITSAKPIHLMFGKVLGVGAASLTQLLAIIVAGSLGVALNRHSYEEYGFVLDILGKVNGSLIFYAVIYFLLGYFLYAFMLAAFASTVSKPEEASSASTVPILILMVSFVASLAGMAMVEAAWVKVLSFIPFCIPMVMIMRIAMTEVPFWQILVSIAEMLISLYFVGYLSSKLFRLGVLMYGKAPTPKQLLKMMKQA